MTLTDTLTDTVTGTKNTATEQQFDLPAAPTSPLLPVVGAGLPVPLVTGEWRPYANLDYAASAPPLRAVADHLDEILPYYSSVHRGAGFTSQVSTGVYEKAREIAGRFVGARHDDVVVFTRNTTDSLNLLARSIPDGGEVVVLQTEHHAALLPWQTRRIVEAAPTLQRTVSRLRVELSRRPAALLVVAGASNVTGEQLPLGLLASLAHRNGARIAVDGAQLVPHQRIDLVASQVDYVAFSGHKLYAPWGAGALVGRRDWLDAAAPYLSGGGAVRQVTSDGVSWGPSPARHEAGSPNVVGVAALARACDVIDALPEGSVEAHEAALRRRLVAGLATVPGVRTHRIWSDSGSAVGVVSFSVDGHSAGHVAAFLSAEHGVGVRDGRFCAHPLALRLGIPDGAVRASIGFGSTAHDIDRLIAGLGQLMRAGSGWTYTEIDGRPAPDPDPRPWPVWAQTSGSVPVGSPCTA